MLSHGLFFQHILDNAKHSLQRLNAKCTNNCDVLWKEKETERLGGEGGAMCFGKRKRQKDWEGKGERCALERERDRKIGRGGGR